MKNRLQLIKGIIGISLIVIELVLYLVISKNIAEDKARYFRAENEFLRTIDCATLFDNYPGSSFEVKFEICAEKPGEILVYQQNASTHRYSFSERISVTEEFKEFCLVVNPVLTDEKEKMSYLAFYGEYGSGVVPTVRDISILPIQ